MTHGLLVLELLVLFVGLPLGFRFSPWPLPALPVLWAVAGYAWWQLWRDPTFDRARLWDGAPLVGHLGQILPVFAGFALVLWLGVRRFAPELEFGLVRERPWVWAAVMVLYPTSSVLPQGLLYRAFFLQRYAVLFPATQGGRWALLLVCATAFAYLHLIFRNGLAIGLTFLGGVLFTWRYEQTGSLLVSSVEHALYGCSLFTVGLGDYFYHRAAREPREGTLP